jgi:hypothetical protein
MGKNASTGKSKRLLGELSIRMRHHASGAKNGHLIRSFFFFSDIYIYITVAVEGYFVLHLSNPLYRSIDPSLYLSIDRSIDPCIYHSIYRSIYLYLYICIAIRMDYVPYMKEILLSKLRQDVRTCILDMIHISFV